MKTKVLLMNSPHTNFEKFDRVFNKKKGNVLFPPLSLTTLSGSLLKNVTDVSVEILDNEFEVMKYFSENINSPLKELDYLKQNIINKIKSFKPKVVGLSLLFSQAHPMSLIIADLIKKHSPETIVVCGGNHATFAYKRMLEMCQSIDFIFLHEADHSFSKFIKYVQGKLEFDKLRGVAFRDKETNEIKLSPPAERINDLDNLPIPKTSLINIKDYHKYGRMGSLNQRSADVQPTYTIQTCRGCTAECTFCSVRQFNGKGVRGFSAKRVLEEIDYVYNDLGIKQIEVIDDDFSHNRQRTLDICNGLIKRNYDLEWSIQHGIRLTTLTDEVMHAMVLAKCRMIAIGVESGNDESLKIIKKPMSVKLLYSKSELFKKHPELYVRGNWIVGFPFEDDSQTMNTFKVANEIGFDWNQFNVFRPIVGTPEFDKLSQTRKNSIIDNQKDLQSYNTSKKFRDKLASEMKKNLLNDFEADKYSKEIDKQMMASMMVDGSQNEEKRVLSEYEEETAELAYLKNLEMNFLNNKNLNGMSINKSIETHKGTFHVNLKKSVNYQRAINDFKQILDIHDPNHAIAHFCLYKAYKFKFKNTF